MELLLANIISLLNTFVTLILPLFELLMGLFQGEDA